eukprot:TRINITY_DN644_c0_g1_i2.p1 TRINITY_DN644_c0_g1~~TRINITY_DN644_c0_g1_i2.p1  ORF type:complete len:178 (-),score=47.84 TRINITY_DN644_c0_g1_i2:160-693(-)
MESLRTFAFRCQKEKLELVELVQQWERWHAEELRQKAKLRTTASLAQQQAAAAAVASRTPTQPISIQTAQQQRRSTGSSDSSGVRSATPPRSPMQPPPPSVASIGSAAGSESVASLQDEVRTLQATKREMETQNDMLVRELQHENGLLHQTIKQLRTRCQLLQEQCDTMVAKGLEQS